MAYDFKKLLIWQDGYKLLLEVYELTYSFPVEEKYSLTTQLRKSANSIIANIAEAHGRKYTKDKIRVLYQSRGEIEETRSHLLVARGLGYCKSEDVSELDHAYSNLARRLNAFINKISES